MDYVIKVNWKAEEVLSMPFNTRAEAVDFIEDVADTLQRVASATDGDDGCAFGVSCRRQADHTVGVAVHTCNDIVVSYMIAGTD